MKAAYLSFALIFLTLSSLVCAGSGEVGVTPSASRFNGGIEVTISGTDLGNGSDITNVTLCGAPAAIISQSATQVVVTAGPAVSWGTGHVSVVSTSQGESRLEDGFAYRLPGWIGSGPTGWTETASMPEGRRGLAAVAVTGRVWAIGGNNAANGGANKAQSNVWEYVRVNTGSWWEIRTPIPSNLMFHAAATVEKKVYVMGGFYETPGVSAECWFFDTADPGAGWQSISNLPEARMQFGAAATDGKIYAVGGRDPYGNPKVTVWRYDSANPSGGWTSVSNLPEVRQDHAVAELNGRIYVVGGNTGAGATNTVWEYNPARPESGWTAISNLPTKRKSLGVVGHLGRLCATGGSDGATPQAQTYCYDPAYPQAGWKSSASLPVAVMSFGAAVLDRDIMVFGGEYLSGTWMLNGTVNVARIASGVSPAFGTLAGGTTVTIVGGNLGSGSDITNVTVCGVTASIVSQSDTQVVVETGAALDAGSGDVIVYSETIGVTVSPAAFTYRHPNFAVRDSESGALTNNEPASIAHGTDFRGVLLEQTASCPLTLANTSTVPLAITAVTTNGAGARAFVVNNCPTSLAAGGTASITVDFTPVLCAAYTASVTFVTTATNSPFIVNLRGEGMDITSTIGPAAGGNTITIYGAGVGDGSDITNVTLCGESAAIVSQTETSVTVVVTAGFGTCDIVVQSASQGDSTLAAGYRYNPQGYVIGSLSGWTAVSNLPAARYRHGSVSVDGKLYVYGGSALTPPVSTVYVYDTVYPQNGWTTLSNMPEGRWAFAAAAAGGKVYCVGGGSDGPARQQTFVYDPEQPAKGWWNTNWLPRAVYANSGASWGTRIFSIGGTIYSGAEKFATPDVHMYDPAEANPVWTSWPSMPLALSGPGTVALDGNLYAVAGAREDSPTQDALVMDLNAPAQGWTTLSNLPVRCYYHAVAAAYGRVYTMGGYGGDAQPSAFIYEYSPAEPERGWKRTQNLPSVRHGLAAATISNTIYISGGYSGGSLSQVHRSVFAPGISPQYSLPAGGITVTLSGVNLGSGSDITNVTLAGVPVLSINSQSATQVVVTAAPVAAPTSGPVVVCSESFGVSCSTYDFQYVLPELAVLGTNHAVVANGEAASREKGTDFGAWVGDVFVDRTLFITNIGYLLIPVTGVTTAGVNAASFVVQSWPETVDVGKRSNLVVRFTPPGVGLYTAVVHVASGASNSPCLVNLRGVGCALSTNIGPGAGGNTLTIDGAGFGDGADITNVTVCGVAAAIVSQSTTQLVVNLGGPHTGSGDIMIYSTSAGIIRILNAYTYNPAGRIFDQTELCGWAVVSNLPVALYFHAAATVGGRIYSIGGYTGVNVSAVYVYDTAAPGNGWVSVSNLPVALRSLAASSAGGKVYAVGGYGAASVDTAYAYDPASPEAGWTAVSNLPARNYTLAAACAGDGLYAVGGRDAAETNSVYRYDTAQPDAGWMVVSNLPAIRDRLAAASHNGMVYAIGGAQTTTRTNVFVMDGIAADGWTEIAGLPAERRVPGAATAQGRIFLTGGRDNSDGCKSTVYEYNPLTPAEGWKTAMPLPSPRGNHATVAVNDRLYVIGGQDGANIAVKTVYESRFESGVLPARGRMAGGDTIVISGTDLCNGGDVTNVYLCGLPVAAIISQSATQVVVTSAASGVSQTGDVAVCSVSFGTTVKTNAFTYAPMFLILANLTGSGTLNPAGEVLVDAGGSTGIVASADPYWHIEELLTNGSPDAAAAGFVIYTSVWENVAANGSLNVSFVENLAALGTPEWWLAQYGWTSDFDYWETNDTDTDLFFAWEERIADTDPTDSNDFFFVANLVRSNGFMSVFDSSLERIYSLQGCMMLTTGEWLGVGGQTNRTGTGTEMTLTDTNAAPVKVYRVEVKLP